MGGKNKKSKSAQNSDVSNPKPRTDVDSVKHIYKRLRKGLDLKTLGKEAESLERIKPSAVTRLCRAKVELCQTAESMQDKSLFELSARPYPTEPSFETLRDQILHVIELTREGAALYSSLLCGVLCVKLARVMGHRPENFNLPRTAEEYLDPNSEIIEQVCPVNCCVCVCGQQDATLAASLNTVSWCHRRRIYASLKSGTKRKRQMSETRR